MTYQESEGKTYLCWIIKMYLCIVDNQSKFPVVNQMDGLNTDGLIKMWKILFVEFILMRKIMSDAGTNFVLANFREFCRHLNIYQVISSWHNHEDNWQAEQCVKLIKHTMKKCVDTNYDVYLALLLLLWLLIWYSAQWSIYHTKDRYDKNYVWHITKAR